MATPATRVLVPTSATDDMAAELLFAAEAAEDEADDAADVPEDLIEERAAEPEDRIEETAEEAAEAALLAALLASDAAEDAALEPEATAPVEDAAALVAAEEDAGALVAVALDEPLVVYEAHSCAWSCKAACKSALLHLDWRQFLASFWNCDEVQTQEKSV